MAIPNLKTFRFFVAFFAMILVGAGSVSAFGVSQPYWNDNPLELYPGQSMEVGFNLQNCPSLDDKCDVGDANIAVTMESDGSGVAKLLGGDTIGVPYGQTKDLRLRVSVPESASVGDRYDVSFSLRSAPDEAGGSMTLGVKYGVSFPVVVIDKPTTPVVEEVEEPQSKSNVMLIIIVLLFIVGLVYWFSNRKKK